MINKFSVSLVSLVLADRIAMHYDRLLSSYILWSVCLSVRLFVTLSTVAKRYILQQKCLLKSHPKNTILQFATLSAQKLAA